MRVTAVLFDLDDTLMVEEASVEEAFLATCERARGKYDIDSGALTQAVRKSARELWQAAPTIGYCRAIGISSWEGLWARFRGDNPDLKRLREWAPSYRREAWARALADYGVYDLPFAGQLSEVFQHERRSRHIVFSDTEIVLRELCRNYRLGLVTNGLSDLQREKIEGADLAQYFKAIIISGEVGVAKPDPRIFAVALNELAVSAERTLMVGNSLNRDVAGAQKAGLRAVWINRSKSDCSGDAKPDVQVTSLYELRSALR